MIIASILESRENKRMEVALDQNNYSGDQLISIRVPTNLPYYNNSITFQRIDGEIEVGGIYYKYVKCRIYNDSLEMLCIPNTAKMKIKAAELNFSKMVSDFQSPDTKKNSRTENKGLPKILEYESLSQTTFSCQYNALKSDYPLQNSRLVNTRSPQTAGQPPEGYSGTSL